MTYDLYANNLTTNQLELIRGFYNPIIDYRDRTTLSTKIGRMAGKTVRFFQRPETKVVTLTSFWAFETAFYATVIAAVGTTATFFIILPIWAYGTYALFSAIKSMID